MRTGKGRFYCLLLAVMFIMFATTPIGCSCSSKKKDDPIGTGAITVSPGPANGNTGGLVTVNETDKVMLQFTVASGAAITTVHSVKITDIGTGPVTAAAVPAVDLWHDVNGNGIYDSGSETLLAGPTTFNTDRTITFTVNRLLAANTTEQWMVLYDFGASASGTYICTIQDVASDISTSVGGKVNIPVRGGGTGAITGGTSTVQNNTLTVAEGPNNPADDTIAGGQLDEVMLQFSMTAGPGQDVTFTGVTFTASGTGDEVNDVVIAQLWEDTDNDGAPDTEIDTGKTYAADDGTISWSLLTETIVASATKYYILTYDFTASADGTFHVEITDVATDVTATAGGQAIIASGSSPISGPTITVDSTPPYVVRAIFDGVDPDNPAAGDTIKVYFNESITVGTATAASFALPKTGDNLGGGASVVAAPGSNTAVLITLGTTPVLTIPGTFEPATPLAGPSGIDVASGITAGEISDVVGNAAIQLTPNPGVDIKGKFIPDGLAVTSLEENVLEPYGEQSGDNNGYVMIQYFVAAPAAMTNVNLTVEFDDGTGFAAASEGTIIFTSTGFDPSDTGDLRIYNWDAVTDFATAGTGGDNDPVTLRFTFDPGTPGDANDDLIDEISFNLDNKPQALATDPYVAPARKEVYLDASNSWVPGGLATIADYTWEVTSAPVSSDVVSASVTKITMTDYPFFAYFQPDVEGDYALRLQVTTGSVVSDWVATTIHALAPDNFTGANKALTGDFSASGGSAYEPHMPGNMAYDEANQTIIFASNNNTCFNQDMGEYYTLRRTLGRFDTSTLPADLTTTSQLAYYLTYDGPAYEHIFPAHLDSYNNGSSIAASYYHYVLTYSTATGTTVYNLSWLYFDCSDCFRNVIGADWLEWEQADLDAADNPPITGGIADDWLISGRLAQVVRGTSDLTYWLVNHWDNDAGDITPSRTWLVEVSGYYGTTATLNWHDGVAFPDVDASYAGLAYDIVVQDTYGAGNPVAWVTIPTGANQGVYSVDLGVTVGNLDTPTAVADYAGVTPGYLALDEVNGYLFVSSFGDATSGLTAAVQLIDLDTRIVVAEINLPGDYYMEELAVETSTGTANTAMLFGTDDTRDVVHVIWADYSGTTPVLSCLPSIDTSHSPKDIIFENTRSALFVSEDSNNSILTAQPGGTGWIFDHAATTINSGSVEQNAEWMADPVSGDLCMVFQRDAAAGIYFTRTADGGQTWTAPVRVDDNSGSTVIEDPDIAVDPWGVISVVWADDSSGNMDVYLRRSADDGATWETSSFKVNTDAAATAQGNPCVSVDFLGNILVAFENDRGAGNIGIDMVKTVGHQRWTYFGPVDGNIQVSAAGTYVCSDPDIVLAPYPGYMPDCWIAWSDTRTATAETVFVDYTNTTFGNDNASGMLLNFQTADITIADDLTTVSMHPRCAYDPYNDSIVVVWEQDKGNGTGIYMDEGDATSFGTDMVVDEPANSSSGTRTNPYIAIDNLLYWRVVAYDSDLKDPGNNREACWEIMQAGFVGWEGEGMRLNASTVNDQTRPLIHAYPGPVSITTWEDARGGTKDFYSKRQ